MLFIGLIPVDVEEHHQSDSGRRRLALPPTQAERINLSGLSIGLCCVGEEQADLHMPAGATIELSDITATSRPVIATVADPGDPRDRSVGRILRCKRAETSSAHHANS